MNINRDINLWTLLLFLQVTETTYLEASRQPNMFQQNRFPTACRSLVLLLSSVALLAGSIAAADNNDYEKAIVTARREVWKDISAGKASSATVAIMDGGRVVYSEGFGMADREKSVPVTSTTLFNIGSITKVFTATAIMLLVDDGKVKLDDPVTKYLPEFTMADPRYKDITVRMTLNHASGLPGTTGQNNFGFEYNKDFFRQTLESLSRAHLAHAPGEMAPYTNDGFTLAEMIVERVSGQRFTDFLKERALKPLGMAKTGLSVGQRPEEPMAAYYEPGSARREPPEAVTLIGAGGFAGTAEDLCRFADMFSGCGPQIFSAASLAEMKKVQPSAFHTRLKGPQIAYGLGWDFVSIPVYESQGVQVLGKSGGTQNYSSMMYTAPKHRISVAVIEAASGGNAMAIAQDILTALLVGKGIIADHTKPVAKPPEPQPIPAQYAAFEGYYAPLQKLVFDMNSNAVAILGIEKGAETPAGSLIYNDGYFYDAKGGQFYFVSVDGQDYMVSKFHQWGIDMVKAQKLKKLEKPMSLEIDVNGKVWLMRNAKPFENFNFVEAHVMPSSTIAGLPGYVDFLGVKVVQSPEFAGMPAGSLRDQTELSLVDRNGQTWARVSEMLYSPAEMAATLGAGDKAVSIGTDGYSQWLKADTNLVVSFDKPAKGRIVIFPPDNGQRWDSALDSGEVYVAKGSLIEFLGHAGDMFKVRAR